MTYNTAHRQGAIVLTILVLSFHSHSHDSSAFKVLPGIFFPHITDSSEFYAMRLAGFTAEKTAEFGSYLKFPVSL